MTAPVARTASSDERRDSEGRHIVQVVTHDPWTNEFMRAECLTCDWRGPWCGYHLRQHAPRIARETAMSHRDEMQAKESQ